MENASGLPDPIRSDTRPLYLQTTEALIGFLSKGGYRSGDRLPTENKMAENLGVSRATLRVAMGYLETRGHIVRRPGLGTFVAAPVIPQESRGFNLALDRLEPILSVAKRLDLKATIVEREISLISATDEWAAKLDVAVGSDLIRCQIVESIEKELGAFLDIVADVILASSLLIMLVTEGVYGWWIPVLVVVLYFQFFNTSKSQLPSHDRLGRLYALFVMILMSFPMLWPYQTIYHALQGGAVIFAFSAFFGRAAYLWMQDQK